MAGCSWWMLFLLCPAALQPLYCLDNRNKALHQLMVWLTSVIHCSSPGASGLSKWSGYCTCHCTGGNCSSRYIQGPLKPVHSTKLALKDRPGLG